MLQKNKILSFPCFSLSLPPSFPFILLFPSPSLSFSPPHSLWCCHPGNSFLSSSISSWLFQWKFGAKIQQPGTEAQQPGKPAQCTVQKQCVSADRDGRCAQWRDCKYQNLTSGSLSASNMGQLQLGTPGGCFSGLLTAAPCMHAFHFGLSPSSHKENPPILRKPSTVAYLLGASPDEFSSLSTVPQLSLLGR